MSEVPLYTASAGVNIVPPAPFPRADVRDIYHCIPTLQVLHGYLAHTKTPTPLGLPEEPGHGTTVHLVYKETYTKETERI
jgi:hypothetical protein